MLYSVRLDETGFDGVSRYSIMAGAMGSSSQWDQLASGWSNLLRRSKCPLFHARDFHARDGNFKDWSKYKRKRFLESVEKILNRSGIVRVAVVLSNADHDRIKREMRGIKGYHPDSHYGFCFRVILNWTCICAKEVDPDAQVSFMLEAGNKAANNAARIYDSIIRTRGAKYRSSLHAQNLAGFGFLPKGSSHSLEAADYLADRAAKEVHRKAFPQHSWDIAHLIDGDFLAQWHQGMLEERLRRRSFGGRLPATD